VLVLVAFCGSAIAQKLPNVAVLTFQGGKTVEAEQLLFLTGKFTSELIASKAFVVLDRGRMDLILKEQGFQQTAVCNNSECQLQMGQLLGVDYIISGNLVQFGGEFAFRLDYIDVATGRIEKTVEISEKGSLEDVYKPLCEKAAKRLAQATHGEQAIDGAVPVDKSRSPLSLKRKIALGFFSGAGLGLGGGVYFNQQALAYEDDYNAEHDLLHPNKEQLTKIYNDVNETKEARNISYGSSVGTALIGLLLWFWPEGGK
jgi:TolB-like protein